MGARAVVRLPCASGTRPLPPSTGCLLSSLPHPRPLRPELPCSLLSAASRASAFTGKSEGRRRRQNVATFSLRPSFASGLVGCAMDGGGKEGGRESTGCSRKPHFLFLAFLPSSFLPPLTLSPYSRSSPRSPPCRFQMGSESNLRHPRTRPRPTKALYFHVLSPQGREGYCTVAFGDSNSSSTAPERTQQHSRDQSLLCLAADGRRRVFFCKSVDLEEAVGASEAAFVDASQLTQSLRLLCLLSLSHSSFLLRTISDFQASALRRPLPSGCIAALGKRLQDVLHLENGVSDLLLVLAVLGRWGSKFN